MSEKRMTKERWGMVLSAISFALDNDPNYVDDLGEYTDDGYELREAYFLIMQTYSNNLITTTTEGEK